MASRSGNDESLFADPTASEAQRRSTMPAALASRWPSKLGVNPNHVIDGYEDALYYTWKERRLPTNVDVRNSRLDSAEERTRMARLFEQGITAPVGCVLPLRRVWWADEPHWESGEWVVRSEEMFLIPGDSPMGFRCRFNRCCGTSGLRSRRLVTRRNPSPNASRCRSINPCASKLAPAPR